MGKIYNKKENGAFKYIAIFALLIVMSASMVFAASPAIVELGTAQDYIILAKAGISATGTTFVNGDIGVSPIDHTAITGFGALPLDPTGQFSTSVLVSGKIYASNYASPTPTKLGIAIGDMQTAYTDALSRPTSVLNVGNGAGEIGGLTLVSGVYTFDGGSNNVLISTDLVLNGNSNDVWIFQIPGTFNLANGIKVNLSGGAIAKNVFWVVTGATTLGTNSVLQGTILDATSIAIQTGATLNGNALAQTAVTLQSNSINDTTLPIITRNGSINVNVDFNSIYIDAEATAFDSVDGNLTDSIIHFNDVNTLIVGTYVVTYNVTDLSGNKAVQVTRTVNVLDSNKPLITLNGSDLNVEINSIYVDAGATAFDVVDGNLTSSIVIVNSVNTSILGLYTVTYDVNDLSGNSAIQVTRKVTVVNSIILDTNVPVISLIGSDVNVSFASIYVDAGATATDDIDGNLTSSIITFNDVNTLQVGTYVITYDVNDLSGNFAVQVTRTVNVLEHGFNLITNPLSPNSNGWFKAPVVISFVHDANTEIRFCRSDALDGTSCLKKNPAWSVDNNTVPKNIPKLAQDYNVYSASITFSLDGNNSIKYFAISGTQSVEDFNVENAIVHYFPIDKTAPNQQMFYTVAYAPDSYRGISMSKTFPYPITTTSGLILAKLSLTQTGLDALSGINYCQVNFDYALDNNNWGAKLSATEAMHLSHRYSTTGAKVIAVFCIDNADNSKMWLSTSVPVYHVTVLDTNYPLSTSLLIANPNPLNLNQDYNLIYSAPDQNVLKEVIFNVSGLNYSFDINAIKNLDGSFYATITADSNRLSGLVNVIAKVIDKSNFVEYVSNDFNSVKDATIISLITSNLAITSVSFDLNSNNLVDSQLRTDINWVDFVADFNNQTLAVWDLNELSPSTAYTYYVLSLDENQNKIVNTISFTTLAVEVVTTGGGGRTVGGPRVIVPEVVPEVETGPTIPTDTDNTNTDGDNDEVDVINVDDADTNPISGAFGLNGNDNNSQVSPTGLFGFANVSPLWIWLLLLIPAAMLFVASQRIKTQREEAEDEKKRKRDEELAKRSNKK
jgi:hypothetical protein